MFTVIEPSSLRLEGSVPASAVGTLQIGTPVRFEVQGYPDRTFDGTVERIAPAVDPATRQIPILVTIPNEGGTLIAGLFAEGRVATEQREGLVVPVDAVDTTGPVPFVLRVSEGVVERVEVQLGVHDEAGELYEITSGLSPGDTLIVGGARDVAPGTPVRINEAAAPGSEPEKGAAGSADAGAEG
jgi:membrane fusion protein (multidrug efflux system)